MNFLTKISFTLMQRSAYEVEFVCAAFIVGFYYGIVGVEFEMTVTSIVLLVYMSLVRELFLGTAMPSAKFSTVQCYLSESMSIFDMHIQHQFSAYICYFVNFSK
jgi:hypothetical protein